MICVAAGVPEPLRMGCRSQSRVDAAVMDVDRIAQEWQAHGFVILPGYIPAGELAAAMGELEVVFPGRRRLS
jgi:hypothetical protein